MAIKLTLGLVCAIAIAAALQGCGPFGGGSDKKNDTPGVAARPGSVPTATPPAQLPEPILLGAISDGGPTTSGTPGANATPGASGGAGSYTVKSGDTLSAIAAAQNIPGDQQAAWIAEVIRLNNKKDAALNVGEELTLPRASTSATPSATNRPGTPTSGTATPTRTGTPGTPAAGTATPTPRTGTTPTTPTSGTPSSGTPTTGGSGTYTVKTGDTPGAIASSLGVPAAQQQAWIAQMLQLNNTTATGLQIGQVLQLPPIPR